MRCNPEEMDVSQSQAQPAESHDLAHLRAEIVRLQEENKSLCQQVEEVGQLKTELQQAQDRVHVYEDFFN